MGVARNVAGAAGAADCYADVGRFLGRRNGGRNREPAVSAAARDRFGEDAVGLIACRHDRAERVDRRLAGGIARPAGAGEGQAERAIFGAVCGDGEAAIAAAAADRLGRDAVRLGAGRHDVVVACDRRVHRGAAARARASDRGAQRRALRDVRCDRKSAIAAAPADRLRQNAVGALTCRRERDHAGGRNRVEAHAIAVDGGGPRRPAARARTADGGAEATDAKTQRAGNGEAAVAAASAKRLREDAVSAVASGRYPAVAIDRDRARRPAAGAFAADADGSSEIRTAGRGDREAAVAAAAADRLGGNAVRLEALSQNIVVAGDARGRGVAAASGIAADRNAEARAPRADARADREAAVAAAPAKRLGENTVRHFAVGLYRRRGGWRNDVESHAIA